MCYQLAFLFEFTVTVLALKSSYAQMNRVYVNFESLLLSVTLIAILVMAFEPFLFRFYVDGFMLLEAELFRKGFVAAFMGAFEHWMVFDVFLVLYLRFICTRTLLTYKITFLDGLAFLGNWERLGKLVVFLTLSFGERDCREFINSKLKSCSCQTHIG